MRLTPLLLAALLVPAALRPASASPASLRAELKRFQASPGAAGLEFCAVFSPITAAPGEAPAKSADPREVRAGADRLLIPASLTKLATTRLALDHLGADFVFHTRIWADGTRQGDTLRGDLVVAGEGDPFLVSERLWLLAHDLANLGLRRVTGDLVVCDAWISPDSLDPARVRDREFSERPYAARLSSFAVNFNAAEIRIRPADSLGAPAVVETGPLPCEYLRVDSRLQTVADGAEESWNLLLEPDSLGETVRATGTVRRSTAPFVEYRSIRAPLRYSAAMLRAFLRTTGIEIDGSVRIERTLPAGATPLLDFPSLPLRDLVDSANRYSNNFMADQIALALSVAASGGNQASDSADADSVPRAPASLTRAAAWMTEQLRSEYAAGEGVRLFDGSGLSPADRLSGSVLARLLQAAWVDLAGGPEIAASLPAPGGDGTLRRRFAGNGEVELRAKTGTMSNPPASGLAGYLNAAGSAPVVFVLLMNGKSDAWDLSRMKALQEEWVREYLRP